MPTRRRIGVLATGIFLTLSAFPVLADAIDGTWCKDTKTMQIDGPAIVTPGGTATKGDYDRHGFQFVIPPGEPGTGKPVTMNLLGDYDLDVTVGDGPAERWKRCEPTS